MINDFGVLFQQMQSLCIHCKWSDSTAHKIWIIHSSVYKQATRLILSLGVYCIRLHYIPYSHCIRVSAVFRCGFISQGSTESTLRPILFAERTINIFTLKQKLKTDNKDFPGIGLHNCTCTLDAWI